MRDPEFVTSEVLRIRDELRARRSVRIKRVKFALMTAVLVAIVTATAIPVAAIMTRTPADAPSHFTSDSPGTMTTDPAVTTGKEDPGVLPAPDPADVENERIYYFRELEDGSYAVGLKSTNISLPDELVLPSSYRGMPVTAVAGSERSLPQNVTSLIIPEGVTAVYSYAVQPSLYFENISLPDSLTYIDDDAFSLLYASASLRYNEYEGCDYLGNENNPYIVLCAFHESQRESFVSIYVHPDTKFINSGAFFQMNNLISINLPDGLISIGGSAFSGCSSLESVTLPHGVKRIGKRAFANCASLRSVTLPRSLESIAMYAFGSCGNLEEIYFTGSGTEWENVFKEVDWDHDSTKLTVRPELI